jgi:membrane-bound lytic murein transglycosylase B
MTVRRPLAEWQRFGVRLPGGASLPEAPIEASLVSGASRHFLVYDNYDALLGYNCAHAYALSVALLAERIG